MSEALKAYAVCDVDERTGDIFFANHAIAAHRQGADEFGEGELSYVTCHRALWADQYAPGPVPFQAKFDNGWFAECWGCGVRIEQDAYDPETDEPVEFDIVEEGPAIYCTPTCRERHKTEQAKVQRMKDRAIGMMVRKLESACPGVDTNHPHHAHCTRDGAARLRIRQVIIAFDFPGRKIGLGHYRAERDQSHIDRAPHVTVCAGDMEAWKAWRAGATTPVYAGQGLRGGSLKDWGT